MSKAEKFIEEHTKDSFNYNSYAQVPIPWLTPDQARKAVEIAREEIYEWLANHYRDYMHNPTGEKLEAFFGMDMITDLKQVMKERRYWMIDKGKIIAKIAHIVNDEKN